MSELLAIWKRQGEKKKCVKRFFEFISQSDFRFKGNDQALIFRFFLCCRDFNLMEAAEEIYKRFGSKLDDQNLNFYRIKLVVRKRA